LSWCTADYDTANASAYIRRDCRSNGRRSEYSFGVFEPAEGGSHAGGISINRIDWEARCGNLGYWVATRAARRGIGSAAVALGCRFAFEKLALRRIEFWVAAGNLASRRVAEKVGARHEGTLRDRIRHGEGWLDAELFGLVAGDIGAASRHNG
jgi:RimJ/RimL family protein N-acetyltransferase